MDASLVRACARIVAAAAALVSTPALAASEGAAANAAPARVAIEARFSPYRPRIDRGTGGTAWRDSFGTEKRLMLGAEVDAQLLHVPHVGSLGLGAMFGRTETIAELVTMSGFKKKSESATFDLWLVSALAVVRLDVVARETTVPLVPYAKIGPVTGIWSLSGSPRATKLAMGHGRSTGLLFAGGLSFLLDVVDRQAARTMSAEAGIQHAYAFFEYTHVAIPKTTDAVPVGDATWTLGLAIEI